MSARAWIATLGALLLSACATDTVVLLPKDDGSTGAIAASRDGREVVLDTPYATARAGGGRLRAGTSDRARLERDFGPALGAMPQPPTSYTIYFDSGSDDFNAEAQVTVAQLLQDLRARPSPEVTVIGHTDRVGNDADNDALSLQRAQSVRERLVALGLDAAHVDAAGRGSREPLVPTEAGVDEPRNRRVEVSVR
jgi:outer membrane protein OmpA-like peptidoglycan-associated protein